MVFGTFDILHAGHIAFFQQARRYGDKLIVVLARDATVRLVKKHAPFHSERERAKLLRHIDLVDQVILGDKRDRYRVVRDIRPDVLALGYDQTVFVAGLVSYLKKTNLHKIKVVRLGAHVPGRYKSGKIKVYLQGLL